jgi:aryl-alcohol dehydrogenase-like predicted oxidoreductase
MGYSIGGNDLDGAVAAFQIMEDAMNYRRLGKAGIKLSELSFGAWVTFGAQVGEEAAQALMTVAYEAGVNFFDNAEAYAGGEAEIIMGKVLNAN